MTSGGDAGGSFLVVEDEDTARRTLVRMVSRYRSVRSARDYDAAIAELRSGRAFSGFFFDVGLGDRPLGGFDLVDVARVEFPTVPIALVTGRIDPVVVNRAAASGAVIVSKPLGEHELVPFLQRVVAREHGFRGDFAACFDAVSRAFALSPREHEMLAWLVAGGTRAGYLERSGLMESTFKTHVKHILAKTNAPTIADLVATTLRRIVVAGGGRVDRAPVKTRGPRRS